MGKQGKPNGDLTLAKALAHITRVQILHIVNRDGESSPVRISQEIDEPLGNVSYHTTVLHDFGFIELVRKEPRRGAMEHFYGPLPGAMPGVLTFQDVADGLRRGVAGKALKSLTSQAIEAINTGRFANRPGAVIDCQPLALDEHGWDQLIDILADCSSRISQLVEDCAVRLDEQPTGQIDAVVGFAAFEASDHAQEGKE